MKISLRLLFFCMIALIFSAIISVAQSTPSQKKNDPSAPSAASRYFTDVALLDQDGQTKRLYTDLIKGKTIIVNAFFTKCHDSCPVMAGRMARIQDALGEQLGKDVYMLSFSVDPEQDTPAQLKAYGARFKARPGWFFLTGNRQNLEFALRKFGLLPAVKENHLDIFVIGNDRTGLWKKAKGTAPPEGIIDVVKSVVNDPA